jgi:hypothetical protein
MGFAKVIKLLPSFFEAEGVVIYVSARLGAAYSQLTFAAASGVSILT